MNEKTVQIMLAAISKNIELMFEQTVVIEKPISFCKRLEFKDYYMGMLSLTNAGFQAQLIVSFPKEIVTTMLSKAMQLLSNNRQYDELIHSSLGELLNNSAALFSQDQDICQQYPSLELSNPVLWGKNHSPFFCKSEGYSGSLVFKDSYKLHVYLTISPYPKFTDLNNGISANAFLGENTLDNLLKNL
jgi:hypothetical protein